MTLRYIIEREAQHNIVVTVFILYEHSIIGLLHFNGLSAVTPEQSTAVHFYPCSSIRCRGLHQRNLANESHIYETLGTVCMHESIRNRKPGQ